MNEAQNRSRYDPAIIEGPNRLYFHPRVEHAIQENSNRYKMMLEHIQDGYFEVDLDGNFMVFNEVLRSFAGLPPSKIMGMNYREYTDEENSRLLYESFGRLLGDGEQRVGRIKYQVLKDGKPFHIESSVSPLYDAHGQPVGFCGIVRDVTEREEALMALRKSEERFRAMLLNSADFVLLLDEEFEIFFVSTSATESSLYAHHEWQGVHFLTYVHPEDREEAERFLQYLKEHPRKNMICELRFQHTDGTYRQYEAVGINLLEDPYVEGIVINYRDITERKQYEEQLWYQAYHDALTGLPNRAYFIQKLEEVLVQCHRDKHTVAVLFLDLDRFKVINDSLGHEVGDQLLAAVAQRLRNIVREKDTAARLGGDEFVILLESLHSPDEAVEVARRIVRQFQEPFELDSHKLFVTVSVGVAFSRNGSDTAQDLIRQADLALYRVKDDGGNGYEVMTEKMNQQISVQLQLEQDLRKALDHNQFRLYYQPQFRLSSQQMVSMEALLRWEHPEKGILSPDKFIPLAEDSGLIIPIGEWVIREACLQHQKWVQKGFPPVRITVNLSPRQLQSDNLIPSIRAILDETGIDPRYLGLEITESINILNMNRVSEVLSELREMGITILLDDFGSGYTSLRQFKELPLQVVKLDKLFIRDILSSAKDRSVVKAFQRLARAYEIEVIVEGIETAAQLEALRKMKFQFGQGYYFSRPLPPEELEAKLLKSEA